MNCQLQLLVLIPVFNIYYMFQSAWPSSHYTRT